MIPVPARIDRSWRSSALSTRATSIWPAIFLEIAEMRYYKVHKKIKNILNQLDPAVHGRQRELSVKTH